MPVLVAERAFVMADIAGSARLWHRYPELMSDALARHDAVAADAVHADDGEIFKHTGDGFLASFTDVASAVAGMVAYQRALATDSRSSPIEIRSRVCVHRGAAEHRGGDWFGTTINDLARLTELVAPTHLVLSAAAIEQFGASTSGLDQLGTFPVRDLPEPVALYAVRLADAVGPALTIAAGRGLIQFKSEFIGRDNDVDILLEDLTRHRLVTVCGFGGMGKTRLAVEVAQRWAEGHEGSAHFVDLASSEDAVASVAAAVGLPNGPRPSDTVTAETIAKHLGDRPVLLIIDNCEHMIDAAATTCEALTDASTAIRILATSREALEIEGEAVYVLGSLEPEAAIELLRERAATAGAPEISDLLAERLCRRVEHMPLGIELVVARLRQVEPTELADALDVGLDELRTRRRGDQRHATMRSLIEWSYELLSDDERALLLRLSQLPAPWRRTAAAVLGSDLRPEILDELMAKSLVMLDQAGHLRLLEPIRQFCAQILASDPALADETCDALVRWARDIIPAVPDDRDPVFDPQATRELVDQLPNIRRALEAAKARGRDADEAAIFIGLWPLVADGRARSWFGPDIEDTLSRTVDPRLRRTLIRLALQDTMEHHIDLEREERLTALLAELDPEITAAEWGYLQTGRAVRQIVADRVLGVDPAATRELLGASAEVAHAEGRRLDEGGAQLHTAFSYMLNGENRAAVAAAERAATSVRRVNFAAVAALADATAAMALQSEGGVELALEIASAAVPLAENARWETSVRTVHALLLGRVGRQQDARRAVAEIIDLALSQPVPFVLFDAAIALAALRRSERDLAGAQEAIDLAGVGRTPLTIAVMFEVAAEVEFDLGFDRFVESLDPEAVTARAERAATYLRAIRADLEPLSTQ